MGKPFPAALRRLRESKGWTAYRLAKESDVSQITLARLEAGGRDPQLSTLVKLADALGVTLDELCGRRAKA
jgi:transcriptional regulator with XRE-family HTH domain